ncbi:hypothetical protein V5799_027405, partial [Amblyomma americanum]
MADDSDAGIEMDEDEDDFFYQTFALSPKRGWVGAWLHVAVYLTSTSLVYFQGIDGVDSAANVRTGRAGHGTAPDSALASTPRLDGYRFSMVNLEESQDVELDAILGELCALETQFEREINQKGLNSRSYPGHNASTSPVSLNLAPPAATTTVSAAAVGIPASLALSSPFSTVATMGQQPSSHCRTSTSSGGGRTKLDLGPFQDGIVSANGAPRTDSPDNDSAFSDNVSMLSSESSASSGGGNNALRSAADSLANHRTKAVVNSSGLPPASSPCQ